jgi:hypothetical protein
MAHLAREVGFGQTSSIGQQEYTRNASYRRTRTMSLDRQGGEASEFYPGQLDTNGTQPIEQIDDFARKVRIGINASWIINIGLLALKIVAFVLSSSYAVLASAVDSLVDTLSQAVLAVAEHQVTRRVKREASHPMPSCWRTGATPPCQHAGTDVHAQQCVYERNVCTSCKQ